MLQDVVLGVLDGCVIDSTMGAELHRAPASPTSCSSCVLQYQWDNVSVLRACDLNPTLHCNTKGIWDGSPPSPRPRKMGKGSITQCPPFAWGASVRTRLHRKTGNDYGHVVCPCARVPV